MDVRTLADGKPGRRAAAPEPVESWVEVDGKRVRLGLPASLASVAALGAGLAGLAGAGATGDPVLTSDSGESVIQALLNAYQKSVPAGSGTQTAANSDIASTQDTPIESTITGTVVRWLADDGAHVEENEPIVVLEAMKMETAIRRPPRRHQLTRRPADTAAGRRVNRTPLTRNASQSQKQNPDHGRNAT